MLAFEKPSIRRTKRTDQIVHLRQHYSGNLRTPKLYNRAFANVLRAMVDKIEMIDDAWVDPEVVVWMHMRGEITAEVSLSPPVTQKGK